MEATGITEKYEAINRESDRPELGCKQTLKGLAWAIYHKWLNNG